MLQRRYDKRGGAATRFTSQVSTGDEEGTQLPLANVTVLPSPLKHKRGYATAQTLIFPRAIVENKQNTHSPIREVRHVLDKDVLQKVEVLRNQHRHIPVVEPANGLSQMVHERKLLMWGLSSLHISPQLPCSHVWFAPRLSSLLAIFRKLAFQF